MKGKRPRRIPQRTCIGCRGVQGKRELVRVVRTVEGSVEVDPTGRRNGRGAYIHRSLECWDLALKRGGLERGLKVAISPEVRGVLAEFGRSLPSAPPEALSAESADGVTPTGAAEAEEGD